MNDASFKAPRLPADIARLSFEASLIVEPTWIDRIAQAERSAYIAALIADSLAENKADVE